MSQQYSLRWNNHQPNFISMFTTLLNTQTLVDVTLAAEGKHLQAHKVVLSACSTYFQALFVDNPSRHPIVILKDVTFADLRTMVDFMYYGEVNVTEEQLPQVLDTAKLLKIKGLTEMPDSTSLTRAQGGPAAEFQPPAEPEPPRMAASPATSPSIKRRRRRKSSTGSASLNLVGDEARGEDNQTVELVRDGITLSSVPQRRRDFHDERRQDSSQQTSDNPHNLNMDPLEVDNPPGMTQGGQWSMMEHAYPRYSNACGLGGGGGGGGGGLHGDGALYMNNVLNPHMEDSFVAGLKLRRTKHFKRQNRVPEESSIRRQVSEPAAPPPHLPALRKHDSYPQYATKNRRIKSQEQELGSVLIRAVRVEGAGMGLSAEAGGGSGSGCGGGTENAPRASHTPAVRSGPPLSCNFCWNTVDDCGRILRRKTQYHCPECRTNLCIVPCFHEYHEAETEPAPNAR